MDHPPRNSLRTEEWAFLSALPFPRMVISDLLRNLTSSLYIKTTKRNPIECAQESNSGGREWVDFLSMWREGCVCACEREVCLVAFVCCCFACDCVLELVVCRVRFARVSCPRLRFETSYLDRNLRSAALSCAIFKSP